MLFESNFYEAFIAAFLVVIISTIAYKFWVGAKTDELDKAVLNFKISTVSTGFLCLALMFLVPIDPIFSSFGPQTISDVQSNEEVLAYLQNYKSSIARTTQVLYFFIFLFVWGFLSSVYHMTKVFDTMREKDGLRNTEGKTSA